MFTNAADDVSARVARLSGAEIAESIIRTDIAILRDCAELRRSRSTATPTVDEALLCAMMCAHVGVGEE